MRGSRPQQIRNFGRQAICYMENLSKGHTLDFTLEREAGVLFITEFKCEIEYKSYRYLQLESVDHLSHNKAGAFRMFLTVAKNPERVEVRVNGKTILAEEAILIWGIVTLMWRRHECERTSVADVLSLGQIVQNSSSATTLNTSTLSARDLSGTTI